MANRTVKEAKNVHGTNPQYLIEKIIRSRIYDSKYWKEQCFALTAELLVDKAMELRYVGGVYGGNIKPTQFLCLTLKMLQIQPEKDIVVEFIKNEEFKYVRALGAFYLRLTGTSLDCYKYLEALYNDNRKLRRQNRLGHFEIVYMDEFIDELLHSDRVCDIILPRIQKRAVLEENNELESKVSALDEDLDEDIPSEDENLEKLVEEIAKKKHKKQNRERSRSKERGVGGSAVGGGGGGGGGGGSEKRHEKKRSDYNYEELEREKQRKDREREREVRERERENREREREARERERKRYEREYKEDRYADRYADDRHTDRDRERRREKERDRDRKRH